MEKLMKPAEYAKELGISRQAVYAKIKRGILTAKDVEGKLYIVIEDDNTAEHDNQVSTQTSPKPKSSVSSRRSVSHTPQKDYEALLAAKDETISVLKETLKDLKASNTQITTTLRGEIDLLKEAFHEMRTLYAHQLEHRKQEDETIDILTEVSQQPSEWIGVKKFFKRIGLEKSQQQEKLLKRLKKAWKAGDTRIVKKEGKLKLDAHSDYEDLVK